MARLRKLNSRVLSDENQQKNGLYKYDLTSYEETYDIPKKVLKLAGVCLNLDKSKFRRLCWNIYYAVECVGILTAACQESLYVILTASGGSLLDVFLMVPCVGYLILAISKSYKMVFYRHVLEKMADELKDMWPQGNVTEEEHIIIQKALKYLKYIVKVYYWCNIALNTFFVAPPFINMAKRQAGKDAPLILSFFFWVPFDAYQNGYYQFMVVLQTWDCAVSICWNIAPDLLFCVFLSHITTQFNLLAVRITRTFQVPIDSQLPRTYPLATSGHVPQVPNRETDNELESRHNDEMAKIIVRHQTLVRLSGDLEDIFSFSLLLNFLNGSIILCFCGFCAVFVEKWNVLNYKLFLLSSVTELWLLCWYGQKLLDASAGVSHALYNSGWYVSSERIKKIILIVMHRSQKEVCLTTYGFSVISMASYSAIMKTSWSYLSLLINMYE